MTARWREAVDALHSAIAAAAALNGSPLCVPLRNEQLPERIETFGEAGLEMYLNVLDGEGRPDEAGTMAGAETAQIGDGFEIIWNARVELIVGALDEEARKAAFDAALDAIAGVLETDRQLDGKVSFARIIGMDRTDHVAAGVEQVEAADITVELQFLSSRPF